MKAIVTSKYGSPEVLHLMEMEKPTPKSNEVLVKVKYAPVSAADMFIRKGTPYIGRLFIGLFKPKSPIPGTGFSGEIEAVGADVKNYKVGDAVFGETIFGFSTHAEYVTVPENGVISTLPYNMSFEEAAPLCDGALTSMNFLKNLGKIEMGQKVLINGASGSLGTAAVQLAKHFGAEVTGVCSTKNIDMVKVLGADHVIDYTQQDFTLNKDRYDVIYDTIGKVPYTKAKKALRENGAYISPVLGMPLLFQVLWSSIFSNKKAKFSATGTLAVTELKALLEELKIAIEKGHLKSIIDKKYTLENMAEAHNYVETGHKKGNVVVTM